MRINNSSLSFTIFSFGFTLYIVIAINILFSIISQQNFITDFNFNNLKLGFESGYFKINKKPIGIHLIYNIIAIIFLWGFLFKYNKKL